MYFEMESQVARPAFKCSECLISTSLPSRVLGSQACATTKGTGTRNQAKDGPPRLSPTWLPEDRQVGPPIGQFGVAEHHNAVLSSFVEAKHSLLVIFDYERNASRDILSISLGSTRTTRERGCKPSPAGKDGRLQGPQGFKMSSDFSHQDHRPRVELIDLGTCGSHQDCQPSECWLVVT